MKILKNRLIIGCICIIAAFAVGFIAVPFVTDMLNEKISVVVVAEDIPKGTEITQDMFRMIRMSKGDLPYAEGEYYNYTSSSVVPSEKTTDIKALFTDAGTKYYAAVEMKANDILTAKKLSATDVYKDEKLRELEPNQYAVAITVNTIAEGIAAKVMAGDIVMPLIYDSNLGSAKADSKLMYVEVLNVMNSEAAEINDAEGSATGVPSVVTLKVNLDQAIALAGYENTAEIHLALVSRGDEEMKAKLLKMQSDYLSNNTAVSADSWFYVDSSGEGEAQ